MGLNIYIERFTGKTKTFNHLGHDIAFPEIIREKWFDSNSYHGDKDFVTQDVTAWDYKDGIDRSERNAYCRPVDFNELRLFVKNNIYKDTQKRLLRALDKMEKNSSLYFYFSL